MFFEKLPKTIILAIMLIRALDIRQTSKLIKCVNYLWREFFIKVRIVPVIKEYKISFSYKDKKLYAFTTDDIVDLIEVAEKIKLSRINK